ncbi:MAG: hypothetical protein WCR47_01820, partial [Desulfoplanes sp.]
MLQTQSVSHPSSLNIEGSDSLCPVVYVCLLSQYTVATAQAIKSIRPEKVIAISSAYVEQNNIETRFLGCIRSWGIPVEIMGNSASKMLFVTDSLAGSLLWMKRYLVPVLEKLERPGLRFFANLTGSTKAASIALDKAWKWDERHYTAEGTRNRINVVGHPAKGEFFSLPSLDFLEEVRLLNDDVRSLDDPWKDTDPTLVTHAVDFINDDYHRGQKDSVLCRYQNMLNGIWFNSEDREILLAESGIKVNRKDALLPPGDLQDFFAYFQSLDPDTVYFKDTFLRIPAKKTHPLVRFVTGIWWEILVTRWFQEEGISAEGNVVINRPKTKTADSETDLLVRSGNGTLSAVECKVALPGAAGAIDIVKILNDLSEQFGKTNGVLALSPAFWWNFSKNQRENFEQACKLRHVVILQSREDITTWVSKRGQKNVLPPYQTVLFGRSAAEILQEAETCIGAWQEDKKQLFQKLKTAFYREYPLQKGLFDEVASKNLLVNELKNTAYSLGRGFIRKPSLADICARASQAGLSRFKKIIEEQYKKGCVVCAKAKKEQEKKSSGGPLSTVTPRVNKARPVSLPKSASVERHLPHPPDGLHPNDIRALAPAREWTLLLDETGSDFTGHASGQEGKFVGLLVNTQHPGLTPLPRAWHAVECDDPKEIDQVFQQVLDAPCGIIGLPLGALPETSGERWLDGMLAVIDWVLRLLPLKGQTKIRVAIEGRPPFPPKIQADVAARDALSRLGRVWPERAKLLDLGIETIGKDGHPCNGYVDVLAYTWGSSMASSRERLKRSQLKGTCFLSFDARAMASFWDTWDRPGGISPAEWTQLVTSADACHRESIAYSLLFDLAVVCIRDSSRLQPFMDETRRHLASNAINLTRLGRQIEWLQAVVQNSASFPPAMRLIWLTTTLAQANHLGNIEEALLSEMQDLGTRLREEDAPLVCYAHLHLAVHATNRFDFRMAEQMLEPWATTDPAVPGLRYWGQIQSSLGQVAAFNGDNHGALLFFGKALDAFGRLSDPMEADQESSQTLCYKLIVSMDDDRLADADVREVMIAYLRIMGLPEELADVAAFLAQTDKSSTKYT